MSIQKLTCLLPLSILLLVSGLLFLPAPPALGQVPPPHQSLDQSVSIELVLKHCPRVADPKLTEGEIPISFYIMPTGKVYGAKVVVMQGALTVREIYSGSLTGQREAFTFLWDGKDDQGLYAEPGDYTIRITARRTEVREVVCPISIVRLGIIGIRALPNGGDNEWQMVYFKARDSYQFYATPAISEYANIAMPGDISDLDLDTGDPRPAASLHLKTDCPVEEAGMYATHRYNYPLCYLKGVAPVFEVTLGADCTSAQGVSLPCGYPITGVEIRGQALDESGAWLSQADDISPGQYYTFIAPPLPDKAARTDRNVVWHWEYRKTGEEAWHEVPGYHETLHRFYTIVNTPVWTPGATGTQYAGPWVETAEYFCTWAEALQFDTATEADVVKAFIRGYFGQEGPLTTAIEGVVYDTYTMGGDGGASHYYSGSSGTWLTRLLDFHAKGKFVNCSDVASTTSTMLGMLGIQNVEMFHLGYMKLRALWGIGCPDYTLTLWGSSHSFSYHHIITRDGGVHVSDACMWLDEDGDPDSLPGTPGYNHDRLWHWRNGYDQLSSTNTVSTYVDGLPKIK
jgi:hypothetical protein